MPGFHGPDPRLVAVAEQYAADHGIDFRRQATYVNADSFDTGRAERIAGAYAAMEHAAPRPTGQRPTPTMHDAAARAGLPGCRRQISHNGDRTVTSRRIGT